MTAVAQVCPSTETRSALVAPYTPFDLGLPGLPWDAGIVHIQFMDVPDGWTKQDWRTVQVGCLTLAARWGEALAKLGWTEVELFGIDPVEPANKARWGLALLHGHDEDLVVDKKRVITGTGTKMREHHRRPQPLPIAVWDAVRPPWPARSEALR